MKRLILICGFIIGQYVFSINSGNCSNFILPEEIRAWPINHQEYVKLVIVKNSLTTTFKTISEMDTVKKRNTLILELAMKSYLENILEKPFLKSDLYFEIVNEVGTHYMCFLWDGKSYKVEVFTKDNKNIIDCNALLYVIQEIYHVFQANSIVYRKVFEYTRALLDDIAPPITYFDQNRSSGIVVLNKVNNFLKYLLLYYQVDENDGNDVNKDKKDKKDSIQNGIFSNYQQMMMLAFLHEKNKKINIEESQLQLLKIYQAMAKAALNDQIPFYLAI